MNAETCENCSYTTSRSAKQRVSVSLTRLHSEVDFVIILSKFIFQRQNASLLFITKIYKFM